MERVIINHKILTYLSRLEDQLIISNKSGESTLAKACETLVRELFSILYDRAFLNTNLDITNFPSIDLHEPNEKIAIQVTSNTANAKISDTLDKFLKYKLNNNYNKLLIVILGHKSYNPLVLTRQYESLGKKYKTQFDFDVKNDILDLSKLYQLISQDLSSEKVAKVLDLLDQYFLESKGIKSLEHYYDELKKKFFDVVMDDPKGLTLNSIYTEPAFLVHETCANTSSEEIEAHDLGYMLNKEVSIHKFLNDKLVGESIYDDLFIYPKSKLIFILGFPGQGKTSMCSKLIFDQLTIPRKKNLFYLKLRNIIDTQSLIHNPFNVIFSELENELGSGLEKSMLKNSVTILDGLDELYMKDNLNANDIEVFCKDLMREAQKHPNWQIIITTRHGYVNFERLYKESYIALILKPLDLPKQKNWLKRYHDFHPETWFTVSKLEELVEKRTYRHSHLTELIDQPLLLYIVASLEEEIAVDSKRAEVYSKLFDQIIARRYSKDGQIENLKGLSTTDLRTMLQEIAYLIFISGNEFVTTKEILESEEMQFYLEKIGENHLSGTLKGILISFYFTERNQNVHKGEPAGIEFLHKSLQEFLTAERIINTVFKALLNKDRYGEYIIRKPAEFLKFLNDIFGAMEITVEISQNIEQLLIKRNQEEKEELATRLSQPIEYFFEKDFLYEVKVEDKNPFTKSLITFSSYWHFIQNLGTNRNFITSDAVSGKLTSYFNYTSNSSYISEIDKFISNQLLEGVNLMNWNVIGEQVSNTPIIGSSVNSTMFHHCEISNLEFIETGIYDVSFYDCTFDKLYFTNCNISQIHFDGALGKKIEFDNCVFLRSFSIVDNKKKIITLKNCTIDESILNSPNFTKHVKLINCVSRKRILDGKNYKTETVDTPIDDIR